MLVTNWQFVNNLLDQDVDVNDIFRSLFLSMSLIKKYGKLLFVDEVLSAIKAQDKSLFHFLQLLKLAKKNNISDLKAIVLLLKKSGIDYDRHFVVRSSSSKYNDKLLSFLQDKFDHLDVTDVVLSDESQVSMSGEWWYYKRGLEQDVKRMLGL